MFYSTLFRRTVLSTEPPIVALAMFITFSIPAPVESQILNRTVRHDELNRSFSLFVPEGYDDSKNYPLVVNMHGLTGTNSGQINISKMNPVADAEGFLVAYPQATGNDWAARDNVGFLEAMLDDIAATHRIDANRIYSTGFSQGGAMSYNLASSSISDRIAAIASVSGPLSASGNGTLPTFTSLPDRPIPMMHIQGTDDPILPYNGGPSPNPAVNAEFPPIDDVVNAWSTNNGCSDTVIQRDFPDLVTTDSSTVTEFSRTDCAVYTRTDGTPQTAEVLQYRVNSGGHEWPGGMALGFGANNRDINASQEIWNFFERHTLPTEPKPFSEFVVFGASHVDAGNLKSKFNVPVDPPYYNGRFSDGPTWVDLVAEAMGVAIPESSERGGTNYAWGGATTGTTGDAPVTHVANQISEFLNGNEPAADQLFILHHGAGNDARVNPNADPATNILKHARTLIDRGAEQILIGNSANIELDGIVPEYRTTFNAGLVAGIDQLRTDYPDANIWLADFASIVDAAIVDLEANGFTQFGPACTDCGNATSPNVGQIVGDPSKSIKFDDFHFSSGVHRLWADSALSLLLESGTDVLGDFNGDGHVDVLDIDAIGTALQTGRSDSMFDINEDGVVNVDDRIELVSNYLNTYLGDSNLDGEFNSGDLVAVLQAGEYEDNVVGNSTWVTDDWNGDGEFDTGDLVAGFTGGGYEIGPREAINSVPEPKGVIVLAFFVLLVHRRLRFKVARRGWQRRPDRATKVVYQ